MQSATFFNRGARTLRELTWRHARLILYVIYIAVIVIVCALLWFYRPQLQPFQNPLDAWLSEHLGSFSQNVLASLLAALIVFAAPLAFMPRLDTIIRTKLLRINPSLRRQPATREILAKYVKVASSQIERLLEDDIKRIAAHHPDISTVLVKMRADEKPSQSASAYGLRIPDLTHFIDSEYLLTPLETVPPLVIEGAPGSGKSTLLFDLFRTLGTRLKEGQGWIPIVVFLHDLRFDAVNEDRPLKDVLETYLLNLVKTLRTADDQQAVLHMAEFVADSFNNYRFVIIFDGLDEFTDRTLYRQFSESLDRLISNSAPQNRFFVSCRDEDNFGRIAGRTVSIQPMIPKQVDEYLEKLQGIYSKDPQLEADGLKVRNVQIHLHKSQAEGVLQNYVSNPYLLSQIIKYYKEESAVAGDLRMIFKAVLDRELKKANDALHPGTKFEELGKYASSLLAPFCYGLALRRLASDDPASGNPEQKLSQPIAGELGTRLFSTEKDNYGLISGVYWGKNTYTQYGHLVEDWGRKKAAWFQQYLATERRSKPDETYDEFQARALDYLSKDLVDLIREANLLKFDPTGAGYNRLRHRRLEDYFTALYVDQRGFTDLIPYLSSGWAREPLRIVSAISSDPAPLIEAFAVEFDRLYAEPPDSPFSWLNRLCNLLLNASSAIAYLPRRPKEQADEKLRGAIQRVCVRCVTLFLAIRTAQAAHTGPPVRWINLYEISLINFRNLFAAEFWSAEWTQSSVIEMLAGEPVVAKYVGRSVWQEIHHIIVRHDRFYQCLAYEHLTPIKEKHGFFPISRLSLFGYAADLFLFSRGAYVRLVADARPNLRDRWPTTAAFWLERIACAALAFVYARWLWNSFGFSMEAALWLLLTAALLVPCAFLVQRQGLLDKWQAIHLPWWLLLRSVKRVWSYFTGEEPLLVVPALSAVSPHGLTNAAGQVTVPPVGPGGIGVTGNRPASRVKAAIRIVLAAAACVAAVWVGYPIARESLSRGIYQTRLFFFLQDASSLNAPLRDLSSRIEEKTSAAGDVATLTGLEKASAGLQDSVAALRAKERTLTDDPVATPLDRARAAEAGLAVEAAAQLLDRAQSKLAAARQAAEFLAAASKLETDIGEQVAHATDSLHGEALENAIVSASALLSNCDAVKAQGRVATPAAAGTAASGQLEDAVARIGRSCADLALTVSAVESRQLVEVAPSLRSQADDALARANEVADPKLLSGLAAGGDRLASTIAKYASRGSDIQAKPNAALDPGIGAALRTISDAQSQTQKVRELLASKLDEADNSARVETFVAKTVTPLLRQIDDFFRSLAAPRRDNSLAALTTEGRGLLDQARAAVSRATDLTGRALTPVARSQLTSALDALQAAVTRLAGEVNTLTGEQHTAQLQDFRARGIALQRALIKPTDAERSALITRAGAYLSEFRSLGLTPQEQDALEPLVKDIRDKRDALLTPPAPPPPPPPEICQATAVGLNLERTSDFALLQSFVKTGNPDLNEALQEARDANRTGALSGRKLDEAIGLVATLEKLNEAAPSMRAELTGRIDTLKKLVANAPTDPKARDCLQRVTQQLNVLSGLERELGEFDAIARLSDPNEMRKTLYEARERAGARARKELIDFAAMLSLLGLLIVSYLCLRKYSDRTGDKYFSEIVNSNDPVSTKLDRLENFVIHNPYSLKINRKAVAAFARLVPRNAQGLARLSAVADARSARGTGNLHIEVVALLNEQVKGLQNELSHDGGRAQQENRDLASELGPKAPLNAAQP
jgi:hypothetical protein